MLTVAQSTAHPYAQPAARRLPFQARRRSASGPAPHSYQNGNQLLCPAVMTDFGPQCASRPAQTTFCAAGRALPGCWYPASSGGKQEFDPSPTRNITVALSAGVGIAAPQARRLAAKRRHLHAGRPPFWTPLLLQRDVKVCFQLS